MDFGLFMIIIVVVVFCFFGWAFYSINKVKKRNYNITLLTKELTILYDKICVQFKKSDYKGLKDLITQYYNTLFILESKDPYSAFHFEKQLIDLIDWYCYDYEIFK